MIDRTAAAQARAQGARDVTARPSQRRHAPDWGGTSPARVARRFEVRTSGDGGPVVAGFASVTDEPYEMWDMFGAYTEVVSSGAFGTTLGKDPLVEFTRNHGAGGGLPMAHTRNQTLTLREITGQETTGLWYEAQVDPTRNDVADMLKAMQRGDLAEASFKFTITRGQWSPDWMEYHIEEVDLDRGDVSAVNFGANPNATSGVVQLNSAAIAPTTQTIWSTTANGTWTLTSAVPAATGPARVLIAEAETRHRTL
jgi:HK97 family phage prohead protease